MGSLYKASGKIANAIAILGSISFLVHVGSTPGLKVISPFLFALIIGFLTLRLQFATQSGDKVFPVWAPKICMIAIVGSSLLCAFAAFGPGAWKEVPEIIIDGALENIVSIENSNGSNEWDLDVTRGPDLNTEAETLLVSRIVMKSNDITNNVHRSEADLAAEINEGNIFTVETFEFETFLRVIHPTFNDAIEILGYIGLTCFIILFFALWLFYVAYPTFSDFRTARSDSPPADN